jgi:L-fuculose-phosphate aldolase
MASEAELRQQIADFSQLCYQKDYLAATDGNLSVRLADGDIMCTPTRINKAFVRPEDSVVVDMDGNHVRGDRKASSEIEMHTLIYRLRPDVNAIVHCHPQAATSYAAAGIPLNKALISEVVLALGCIPITEYGTPGTPELTEELTPFVEHYDALLMANHGVVTYGADLMDAYNRMDTVEHFAKISIYTQILGKEQLLSSEDVEKLWVQRQKYFGLETADEARPKDPMCPVTDGRSDTTAISCGPSEATALSGKRAEMISMSRAELVDLINEVVLNLEK